MIYYEACKKNVNSQNILQHYKHIKCSMKELINCNNDKLHSVLQEHLNDTSDKKEACDLIGKCNCTIKNIDKLLRETAIFNDVVAKKMFFELQDNFCKLVNNMNILEQLGLDLAKFKISLTKEKR